MNQMIEKLRASLPFVKPFLPHIAALAFIALLGWANGYFQASKQVVNPDLTDNWAVPNWTPYRAGPERMIVAAMNIWDGKRAVVAKKDETIQKTWQLVGTVRSGKTYAAIIQLSEGKRIQRAVAGDVLPNGEKVIGVENGTLQIDIAGTEQEIKLFQSIKVTQTATQTEKK